MEFRKLLPDDAADYRKIRLESLFKYPNHFCSDYQDQITKVKLAFEEYIEKKDDNNFIIGAFDENKLIGICGFCKNSSGNTAHRGGIIQMYVKTIYQGKKIGYNLLFKTVQFAFENPALERIELGVLSSGEKAKKLYQDFGFEEFGYQRNYLKTEDGFLDQRLMSFSRAVFER